MQKMTTTILFILFSLLSYCPQGNTMVIFEAPVIKPYEPIWNAHCSIESSFNRYAVGDTTLKEWSYGIAQIRQQRLDDYFGLTGVRYYELDMFDPIKSKEVFMYYACQINPSNVERISREWNGGPKGMNKKSTIPYYKKIMKAL